jgi:hypothetical protein
MGGQVKNECTIDGCRARGPIDLERPPDDDRKASRAGSRACRAIDNLFIEWLRPTSKYYEIYVNGCAPRIAGPERSIRPGGRGATRRVEAYLEIPSFGRGPWAAGPWPAGHFVANR